jgi:L-alanine-DL-glutamate epimerase-like enolase superfamily enzyme
VKLRLHQFDLPLTHPFRISRETISIQPTLVVELSDGQHRGYGEATTNAYYGITRESMVQALASVETILMQSSPDDPEGLWQQLAEPLAANPFALCAVDQAAHDLAGKRAGQPVYARWGLDPSHNPLSNFTIGIDEVDVMVAKMAERPAWPIYKIKLGTDRDLEIVRTLRKHTDAIFRVDANCGWDADETIRNSQELAKLGVEFIEQPLPAGQWDAQRDVFERSALPIMADESCICEADVARCHGYFHGINIKLTKCGGLTPARRMISHARQLGLRTMVGCMTESTIGISAIAQLLPLLDFVDMDGAELLARDIATGVRVINGVCHYAEQSGTGAQLLE